MGPSDSTAPFAARQKLMPAWMAPRRSTCSGLQGSRAAGTGGSSSGAPAAAAAPLSSQQVDRGQHQPGKHPTSNSNSQHAGTPA